MRLLFLNANTVGRGTYHRALWFGRICAQLGGHEVTLCTVSRTSGWRRATRREDGIRITEGPNWGYTAIPGYGSNWLDILWRWHEVRTGAYDVIYGFEFHPNVAWPVYAGLKRSQIFLSDWCDWYAGAANVFRGIKPAHRWDRWREERIRRKARRVSVISTELRNRALHMGIDSSRVHLLREGVDTQFMKPESREDARVRLGIPTDIRVIGTLTDGHAFPYLLDAFVSVKKEMPTARLLNVGAISAAHKQLVARRGLEDVVFVTGRCTDEELPLFLAAVDVFALPLADTLANRARFPHKLGDYLACGRAVITTAVGDYPAMLRRDDAALIVDGQDAFAHGLLRLLRDDELRQSYACRGREWVAEKLDWSVLAPDILAFVEGTGTFDI